MQRRLRKKHKVKMGKKNKSQSSEAREKTKEMAPLYTDIACNRDAGISTWEGMYRLLEEEKRRILKVTAVAGAPRSSEASLEDLACSFLHRIAARPKILPYTDMVKWILDDAELNNRQFKIQGHGIVGSFAAQDLKLMYHLPEPQATYNAQFVKKFAAENPDLSDTTKEWSRRDEPLKKDKNGMYNTGSLTSPYCFAAAMFCRLFGMPDINKFSSEWLPLIDAATNADIIYWAKILSDNLYTAVINYRSKRSLSQRIYPPFYLSAYVCFLFVMCLNFPLWVGNGLPRTHYLSMFIIRCYGILSSSLTSNRFATGLFCPCIE